MSTNNLHKRGSTYYARVSTPKPLKELRLSLTGQFGSSEIQKTLKTKDRIEALRLLPHTLIEINRQFDEEIESLRAAGARELTVPTQQNMRQAKFGFIHEELRLDGLERLQRPTAAQIEAKRAEMLAHWQKNPPKNPLEGLAEAIELPRNDVESRTESRKILEAESRRMLRDNEFRLIDWAIQREAQRNGWKIEADSMEYKFLGEQLMHAWLDVLDVASKRDQGVYVPELERPVVVPITSAKKRLKQARELRGLSQRALGALVDADKDKDRGAVRINRYERQTNLADMETAGKLAKELHVPLAFLFAESDELAELILGFDQLDPADKTKVIAQVQKLAGKT